MTRYNILTLNQISSHGLHRFPAARYTVGKAVEHRVHLLQMLIAAWIAGIDHMQQQVRFARFLQRRLKCSHQLVR